MFSHNYSRLYALGVVSVRDTRTLCRHMGVVYIGVSVCVCVCVCHNRALLLCVCVRVCTCVC